MKRSRDIPPPGQPYAAPRMRVHVEADTKRKLPAFVYPYDIVKVRRKEDLETALDHYGHPFPMMAAANTEKNPYAMRYTLEWVFPALRWFCKAYGHDVPSWLQGNGWAEGLSSKAFKRMFGDSKPLQVQEWRPDPKKQGKRA